MKDRTMAVAFARAIKAIGGTMKATKEDVANQWPALSVGEIMQFMELGAPRWSTTYEADADPDFVGNSEDDAGACYAIFEFDPLGCSILAKNPSYTNRIESNWRDYLNGDFVEDQEK